MPFFGRRTHHTTTTTTRSRRRGGLFHRKDRDRVAGGYKAALANPNTTHRGRKHAKHELHHMVNHPSSFLTIKALFLQLDQKKTVSFNLLITMSLLALSSLLPLAVFLLKVLSFFNSCL